MKAQPKNGRELVAALRANGLIGMWKDRPADFWRERTLAELAAEQGVHPINQLEDVMGKGADLWTDEDDFNEFLRIMRGGR